MRANNITLAMATGLASLIGQPAWAQEDLGSTNETQVMRPVPVEPLPPVRIVAAMPEVPPRYPRDPVPASTSRDWITPADMPAAAFLARQEGTVRYELDVSPEGRATACRVLEPSGHEVLDDATCPLLVERARLAPAYDAERNPVAGTYRGAEQWQAREPSVRSVHVAIEYTLDQRGEVRDCDILRSDLEGTALPDSFVRNACNRPIFGGTGTPYRNAAGEPVERRMRYSIVIEEVVPE